VKALQPPVVSWPVVLICMNEIETRVVGVLHKVVDSRFVRSINPHSDLKHDLLLDSLDIMEMTILLEDEFSIKIGHDETQEFKKAHTVEVKDIVAYVKGKLGHLSA